MQLSSWRNGRREEGGSGERDKGSRVRGREGKEGGERERERERGEGAAEGLMGRGPLTAGKLQRGRKGEKGGGWLRVGLGGKVFGGCSSVLEFFFDQFRKKKL